MKKKKDHSRRQILLSPAVWITASIVFVSFVLSLMSFYYPGFSFYLKVGNPAPENIVSPDTFSLIDEEATEKARQSAEDRIDEQYKRYSYVTDNFESKFIQLFEIIENINYRSGIEQKERRGRIEEELSTAQKLSLDLSDETLIAISDMNRLEFEDFKFTVDKIVTELFKEGITQERYSNIDSDITSMIQKSNMSQIYWSPLLDVCDDMVEVNMQVDLEATEEEKRKARESVYSIEKTIDKNQTIILEGEIITSEHVEIIEKAGISTSILDTRKWLIIFFLPMFLIMGLYFIIYWFDPEFFFHKKRFILMGIMLSVFVIASRLLIPINPFLAPIPFIAFLMTVFLGSRLTIPAFLLIAPFTVIFFKTSYVKSGGLIAVGIAYALLALLTCLHIDKVKRFSNFFLVAGYSILGSIVALALYTLFVRDVSSIFIMSGYAFSSSGVQIALAFGLTPLLERVVDQSTVFHLLELSDLNSPLMKKLMLNAPGTYQHSLLVGNIASAACEAIDADSLLARIGGYYHDIGKLKHPDFFIENQTGDNPHEDISPSMSTLIITKHVKEGVDVAKEYRLPLEVTRFIITHHGTTVLKYFYYKARETDPLCIETDFRYKGEKPATIEEAVVMIADAVESAARAQKPERSKIEGLVEGIIQERINDGQLSECPISLAQLTEVKKVLTNQIASTRHERVPYPGDEE